jgi:protein SCO1/2
MRRYVVLGLAIAVAIAVGAVAYTVWSLRFQPPVVSTGTASIGGPFSLTDQNGHTVTDRDLLGKPAVVFFGFTYCPEVCPTTLTNLTAWLKTLGPDADKLNVVFITVDPARDTPKQLKAYLSAFDPRIRGLTGSEPAIAKVARAYRVYYQKVPLAGGGYTVDHSSMIYLMDAAGRFVEPIGYGETSDRALASLRRLIQS